MRFVVGLGRALDEYVPLFTRTAGPMVDKRMVGRMMDADPQVGVLETNCRWQWENKNHNRSLWLMLATLN